MSICKISFDTFVFLQHLFILSMIYPDLYLSNTQQFINFAKDCQLYSIHTIYVVSVSHENRMHFLFNFLVFQTKIGWPHKILFCTLIEKCNAISEVRSPKQKDCGRYSIFYSLSNEQNMQLLVQRFFVQVSHVCFIATFYVDIKGFEALY